jgi:Phage T4 tail fibre
MKKLSITIIAFTIFAGSVFAQGEAPVISANSNFSSINIRANTSSVPIIRFTRWTGGVQTHNAFVGQFYNSTLGEYSFGLGTGSSTTGDQDLNNTLLTATLSGNIGVGTIAPAAKLDVGAFIPGGILGTVFGRLQEGNSTGTGTFLGVRGYATQGSGDVKSFAIEHSFYGQTNASINFVRGGGATGGFLTFNTDRNIEKMRITTNGNVGIGTTAPNSYKLAVGGSIGAWGEVRVFTTGAAFPDYVFDPSYQLPSLEETEKYVKENRHLPEVPSAADIEKDGMSLNGMNTILLKKVEELTLYMIEMKKKTEELEREIKVLKGNQKR